MNEISLTKYVQTHGQTLTAERLGTTQGAIFQALRANREIYIAESARGITAYEVKPFPSRVA